MSWAYGGSFYRTPSQGNRGLVSMLKRFIQIQTSSFELDSFYLLSRILFISLMTTEKLSYNMMMCSGGGFVFGYLLCLLQYSPLSWSSVQRALIGFSRSYTTIMHWSTILSIVSKFIVFGLDICSD